MANDVDPERLESAYVGAARASSRSSTGEASPNRGLSALRTRRLPLPVAPVGPTYEKLGVGAVGIDAPQRRRVVRFRSGEEDPVTLG